MKITVSIGQMDVRLGEPEQNLAEATRLVAEAARRGSDLIVLPELWSTGYDLENAARYATGLDEGMFAQTAVLARQHQIHIVGSCLSGNEADGFRNTIAWVTPTGQRLADYSKIHLFRLMDEDQYLAAGEAATLVNAPWGETGLAICYDLRFPELFRRYALNGAKLIILPAEWPHPRLAHWQTLLRARAIENQLFLLACNRVGSSKGTAFFGHSCLIDPWGETIIEGGEQPMLLTTTMDLGVVDEVRRKIPVFADRRPELYGKTAVLVDD